MSDQLLVVRTTVSRIEVLLGFVHAASSYLQRRSLWESILLLPDMPVCLIGDFNSVLGAHERHNMETNNGIASREFREFIDAGGFLDVDMSGPSFTWALWRQRQAFIASRIDRILVKEAFLDIWASVMGLVLTRIGSDHHPLFLTCNKVRLAGAPIFRFQKMWVSHSDYLPFVKQSWVEFVTEPDPISLFSSKLRRLKKALRVWNLGVFGIINSNLQQAERRLRDIQNCMYNGEGGQDVFQQEVAAMLEYNASNAICFPKNIERNGLRTATAIPLSFIG